MNPTKDHTRVSPEGLALGAQMVKVTEPWIGHLKAQGESDTRCKSCAFRPGTVPNGCLQTQMDALKAVVEKVPFNCHQRDREGQICHGWFAARVAMRHAEESKGPINIACPWDFSPPDDEPAHAAIAKATGGEA
jgi:hypothetical protein